MTEDRVQRKLTTILAADVEGYTRLMRADEEATLKILGEYREIIDALVARHDGRVFSTGGDSVLAEFGSAVEAVRCAISWQEEMASRNADLADDRKLMFRIGINVGDVMIRHDDLFGDGVNVAARLERLAQAGGVCVSSSVFEQVKHKLSLGFEDLGPQEVKNIAEPVATYKVLLDPSAAGTVIAEPPAPRLGRRPATAAMAAFLLLVVGGGIWWWSTTRTSAPPASKVAQPVRPHKASVALVPLKSVSGNSSEALLATGLTVDINSTLSRVPGLLVISQNSMARYRGKSVDATQVAKTLVVDHVLDGTVQRSGDRVRVTMRMVNGSNGAIVWSNRYDREVVEIFKLQDEIVRKVIVELQSKLTLGEWALHDSRGTKSLDAWLLSIRGDAESFKFTRASNIRARELYQAAAKADPNWYRPLVGLAWTYREALRRGWSRSVQEDRKRGIELAQKVIQIEPSAPDGYIQLGNLYIESGRFKEGLALREKALELAPNDFYANAGLAWQLPFVGQAKRALELYRRAKQISPLHPGWLLASEAFALHVDGQHERAIAAFKEALARINFPILHGRLAAVYAEAGQMDEAREQVRLLLAKKPNAKIRDHTRILRFQDSKRTDWYVGLLRSAGVPE